MSTDPQREGHAARPPLAGVLLLLGWAAVVYVRYLAGYLG
jgi:hypothetical protein